MIATFPPELKRAGDLYRQCARLLRPRIRPHPAKWIEQNIDLPRSVSPGRPGLVHLEPYQRAVLDAAHDPAVREIILPWATQLGKSATWRWLTAYYAATDPIPIMVVAPDRDAVHKITNQRLYPILRNCPPTAKLLPAKHAQHTEHINLRDSSIRFGWSGSASSLGEATIVFLILTELDKFTRDTSSEGDPEDLALNRVKNIPNHKIIKESTPSREDMSRIWKNWLKSSQGQFHVPCPHCKKYQTLQWHTPATNGPGVKWSKGPDGKSDPLIAEATAHYQCAHCKKPITDEHKPGMLTRGKWVHQGQKITPKGKITGKITNRGRRGFHLSTLYSPVISWGAMARVFLEKRTQGLDGLQDFWNSWLALPWTDKHEAPEWAKVRKRLCDPHQPRRHVPAQALYLTAGADVQEDRLYYSIWAWGPHRTAWLIDNGQCRTLDELTPLILDPHYPHAAINAPPINVKILAIDSRYRGTHVYDYCLATGARTLPIKGQPRWRATYTFTRAATGPDKTPIALQVCNINVSEYKAEIYHVLKNHHAGEPGALNLHAQVSEDFMRQLCGEAQIKTRDKYNRPKLEWKITDPAVGNHYLDTTVYAYCMADLLGLRTIDLQTQQQDQPDPDPRPTRTNKKTWIDTGKSTWL